MPSRQRRDASATFDSLLHSSLVGAGDAHIFPIFRYRSACDLYALRLKNSGDLLIRQRPERIFFLDQFLDPALEDKQRSVAALGTVHTFAEKVS
jgi:hypothetical protein